MGILCSVATGSQYDRLAASHVSSPTREDHMQECPPAVDEVSPISLLPLHLMPSVRAVDTYSISERIE